MEAQQFPAWMLRPQHFWPLASGQFSKFGVPFGGPSLTGALLDGQFSKSWSHLGVPYTKLATFSYKGPCFGEVTIYIYGIYIYMCGIYIYGIYIYTYMVYIYMVYIYIYVYAIYIHIWYIHIYVYDMYIYIWYIYIYIYIYVW